MAGEHRDRRTLQRIAAVLLSLALLAERAASRSFPVRFLVLVILRRAEAIARTFVANEIEAAGPCPDINSPDLDCPDLPFLDEPPALHFGAADTELLALRLRMLAAVLGVLAGEDGDCDGRLCDWPAGQPALRAPCVGNSRHLPVLLIVRLPARFRPSRPP